MLRRGFTLLELVLVIVLIGTIAAIAVPRMSSAQERARLSSALATYRGIEKAVELYRGDWKTLPGDVNFAVQPPGMATYIESGIWTSPSPIGGSWDWNNDVSAATWAAVPFWVGYPPNIAIRRDSGDTVTQSRMLLMDRRFDDGVAATGQLRRLHSNHMIYPLEP